MPLARNAMYTGGTQIYVAPTWDKSQHWLNAMKFIAKEGGMYVISSCQAIRKADIPDTYEFKNFYPEDRDWINIGNSCIVSPRGEIIAGPLEKEEGLIYANVDYKEIISSKRLFDVTGHYSRPDVFTYDLRG
jgi:nitrilase